MPTDWLLENRPPAPLSAWPTAEAYSWGASQGSAGRGKEEGKCQQSVLQAVWPTHLHKAKVEQCPRVASCFNVRCRRPASPVSAPPLPRACPTPPPAHPQVAGGQNRGLSGGAAKRGLGADIRGGGVGRALAKARACRESNGRCGEGGGDGLGSGGGRSAVSACGQARGLHATDACAAVA